jgi:predicted chitinase
VWHVHPVGLVENFGQSGCGCKKEFTVELFQQFAPSAQLEKIRDYLPEFIRMFERYGITSCLGKAHILAQVLHESTSLRDTKEIGNAAYFATKSYNPHIGRGLIQLTWKKNYKDYGRFATGNAHEFTTENAPWDTALFQKLERVPYCVDSVGWFWTKYKEGKPVEDLRPYADADDLIFCTFAVNGGLTGYNDRLSKLKKIIEIMEMQEHLQKNRNGEYLFEESKIFTWSMYSFAWGLWHDPGTCKDGVTKNADKAIAGYKRFLQLDTTASPTASRKWYGVATNAADKNVQWYRDYASNRVTALGGTL